MDEPLDLPSWLRWQAEHLRSLDSASGEAQKLDHAAHEIERGRKIEATAYSIFAAREGAYGTALIARDQSQLAIDLEDLRKALQQQ